MRGQKIALRNVGYHWQIYLFALPCVLFIGIFSYYPAVNGVYHSFYDWNGGDVERFTGVKNYVKLFTDEPKFWMAFKNALILGLANIIKMAPSIITAVCLHRVRSERLQFFYRVGFVVPMVVPSLVTVLLWKAFYDPTNGAINVLLKSTGLMSVLSWGSGCAAQIGQAMSSSVFDAGGVLTFLAIALAVGGLAYCILWASSGRPLAAAAGGGYVIGLLTLLAGALAFKATESRAAAIVGGLAGAPLGAVLTRPLSGWLRFGDDDQSGRHTRLVFALLGAIAAVVGLSLLMGPVQSSFEWAGNLFKADEDPAWLGTPKWAMLALLLWGFPWVGSFGVLCYLACLQAIGKDIYEAADVDGAGWFTKFRHIELPLILRQVRVMMVLVIMGSINDAGLVMALFGLQAAGGAVQVPALFMFSEAFLSQRMGYACGIGVVLFTIIIVMTKLNEWLVKPAD